MVSTSVMRGTFSIRVVPSASSDAAISFRTEFFAPWTVTSPRSGPGERTMNCCIGATLPPLPGPDGRSRPRRSDRPGAAADGQPTLRPSATRGSPSRPAAKSATRA